jgi:hypothetical protein
LCLAQALQNSDVLAILVAFCLRTTAKLGRGSFHADQILRVGGQQDQVTELEADRPLAELLVGRWRASPLFHGKHVEVAERRVHHQVARLVKLARVIWIDPQQVRAHATQLRAERSAAESRAVFSSLQAAMTSRSWVERTWPCACIATPPITT